MTGSDVFQIGGRLDGEHTASVEEEKKTTCFQGKGAKTLHSVICVKKKKKRLLRD